MINEYEELKHQSFIWQYNEAIKKGFIEIDGQQVKLVVGSKIKKALRKIMAMFNNERYIFNPKYCYKRFKFQQKACLQRIKPYHNVPISLMLWQKVILEATYSFFYKSNPKRRVINKVLIEVGRKNGKSTFMASDINTDLFIGEGGVRICSASNADKTAMYIWKEVRSMRRKLDEFDEITSDNIVEIRNDKKDITVIRMSGKAVNDGDNFAKVVQDEGWDCKNDELPEACERSCSTNDDYLYFIISTNGFINGGWFDKQLEYANAWLDNEIEDEHYLAFLFEQDDESEVWAGDRDLWQKANPSLIYGVKKWSFIEKNIRESQVDKEKRLHLLTKDFNIKISNSKAWLTLEEYDYKQEPFTLEGFRYCVALGSVDLSDCGDLTVAEALFMKNGDNTKYVVPQFFIPQSKLEDKDNGAKYKEWANTINPVTGDPYVIVIKGNKINQKHVADWYQSLRDKYGIETIMIGYDRWHSDIFLQWCDKKTGYGFNTMKVDQNSKLMSFPMKTVERDLNAKLINYCNNPVMKYCFNNTSAKIVNDLIMPEKIDGQYSRKIDGVVALIILYATLEKNELTFNQYLR